MHDFGIGTFGELYADTYDAELEGRMEAETEASVHCLASLAEGGPVLELAIGTGRVALPLAATGLSVQGIEASPEMVAKMRTKPGGDQIPVVIGDMADVAVDGTFGLVFLLFNTLFNLTSQEAQLRCFENVGKRLVTGGRFVVEAYVPRTSEFQRHQLVRTQGVDRHAAHLDVQVHDPVAQIIEFQRIRISEEGVRMAPLAMRYAWPSELDLMARLGGMQLEHRWSEWDRRPFHKDSRRHVSVYRKG